jgi:hypothetical protein
VHYGQPYPLVDTERKLVEGKPLPSGGCHFSETRKSEEDENVAGVEIAYDPDTCRSIFEVGRWVGDDRMLMGDGTDEAGEQSAPGEEQSTPAGGEALSAPTAELSASGTELGRRDYYTWTWYDEPIRWVPGNDIEDYNIPPVNWVRNSISYWPGGKDCLLGNQYPVASKASTQRDWLRETDWREYSFTPEWTPAQPDPDHPGWVVISCDTPQYYSKTTALYANNLFCDVFNPLRAIWEDPDVTEYTPNAVAGDRYGNITHTWESRKEGPCSWLLRKRYRYGNGPLTVRVTHVGRSPSP